MSVENRGTSGPLVLPQLLAKGLLLRYWSNQDVATAVRFAVAAALLE